MALALASARRWPAFAAELAADVGRPIGYRAERDPGGGGRRRATGPGPRSSTEFQRALGPRRAVADRSAAPATSNPTSPPGCAPPSGCPVTTRSTTVCSWRALLTRPGRRRRRSTGPGRRRRAQRRPRAGGAPRRTGTALQRRRRRRGGGVLVGPPRRAARRRRPPGATGEGADPAAATPRTRRRADPDRCAAMVQGSSVYLVPRADGTRGGGRHRRGAGLRHHGHRRGRLRAPARRRAGSCPASPRWSWARRAAGLRPGSPDNAPIVGRPLSPVPTAWWWPPATTARASCWRRSRPTAVAAIVVGGRAPRRDGSLRPRPIRPGPGGAPGA